MNKILLTGNLGRDAEMRYTPSGKQVANFSIAVTEKYTDGAGEKQEKTIWVNLTAWGKLAEFANTYLKKGAKVLIEGRLENPYAYSNHDEPAASNQVTVQTVEVVKWPKDSEPEQPEDRGPIATGLPVLADVADDLPF
jgi:single-strand DNA-binding protein